MEAVNIASNILTRAVELDNNKRYTESLVCYQEGIQLLMDLRKSNFYSNFIYKLFNILIFFR